MTTCVEFRLDFFGKRKVGQLGYISTIRKLGLDIRVW